MHGQGHVEGLRTPSTDLICLHSFGEEPHLTKYLTRRLTEVGASAVETVVLNQHLTRIAEGTAGQVTEEAIARLGVDHDADAVARLCHLIHPADPDLAVEEAAFSMRVTHDVVPLADFQAGGLPFEAIERDDARANMRVPLLRIFYCAYAMLMGYSFDPR